MAGRRHGYDGWTHVILFTVPMVGLLSNYCGRGVALETARGERAVEPAVPSELELVAVLQAMSDPLRLTMLTILADRHWHPCTGDWAAGLHKSTISHHIRILREAGLLETQKRGRNKYVRLRRDAIDERFPGLLEGVLTNA